MFISILYMFRSAMCPSLGELLYQCDTLFVPLCVDDRLVCKKKKCVKLVIYKEIVGSVYDFPRV